MRPEIRKALDGGGFPVMPGAAAPITSGVSAVNLRIGRPCRRPCLS